VTNLEEIIVKNATEIYHVLDRGSERRAKAETLLNAASSRSHSVFTITMHMRDQGLDGEEIVKVGKLNLVDLAGSENISKSGAKDQRAREAGNINQSLLCLGRVISALVEKQGYVPYRDSKLTRLLRESLGGKAKTCIIATIAPTVHSLEETTNTLDYAHRAKNIRNRPEVNQKVAKVAMLKDYANEIDKLRAQLEASREKNGVHLPLSQYKAMEESIATQQLELEAAAQERVAHAETLTKLHDRLARRDATIRDLRERHARTAQELAETVTALRAARDELEELTAVVKEQEAAQKRLIQHGVSITQALDDAHHDLTDVHAALSARAARETGNAQTVAQARADLAGGLIQLRTSLQATTAAHTAAQSALLAQLEQMRATRASQAEVGVALVRDVAAAVGVLQREADAGLARVKTAADQGLTKVNPFTPVTSSSHLHPHPRLHLHPHLDLHPHPHRDLHPLCS
jgi:kinesin family member 11